jgi:hypothetical protein
MFLVAAVPWRMGEVRPNRDESAAVQGLRNIAEAQERFKRLAAVDADQDGVGEYGYFTELSDSSADVDLEFPLLPMRFTAVDESGRVKSIRYYYRMCVGSDLVPEPPGGGREGVELDDSAEECWACYAWPVKKAKGCSRAFYCDQDGVVMQSTDYTLTGSNKCPVAGTWTPCR